MHDSKQCFKCLTVKPLSEFYAHKMMADGHLNKCKACAKSDVTENRNKRIDYYRAKDLERAKHPDRIAAAVAHTAAWRASDKRLTVAHSAVARALRKGELIKQNCCVCGSDKSLAHHESYDRPLDVVWYCQPHHKERHKQMAIEGKEA